MAQHYRDMGGVATVVCHLRFILQSYCRNELSNQLRIDLFFKDPMLPITSLSPFTSIISFTLGLPTAVGTYYMAWKTRQEARRAREGYLFSANCLEFVLSNGVSVNLIPLESLHTLPKPGDVVLLPASGFSDTTEVAPGAFRVDRIEHIYAQVLGRGTRPKQARLVKAVAHVDAI